MSVIPARCWANRVRPECTSQQVIRGYSLFRKELFAPLREVPLRAFDGNVSRLKGYVIRVFIFSDRCKRYELIIAAVRLGYVKGKQEIRQTLERCQYLLSIVFVGDGMFATTSRMAVN